MIKIYCFYKGHSGGEEKCPHKGIAYIIEKGRKVVITRSNSTKEKWVIQDVGCTDIAGRYLTDYNKRRKFYDKKFGEGKYETVWITKAEAEAPLS